MRATQYAEAMRAAGVTVDLREFGSLMHGFATFFPLGGGSATRHHRDDLGAAGPPEPRLKSRRAAAGTLEPVATKSKKTAQLRPEGSRPQAQSVDPDRADRDRRDLRGRPGALHRDVARQDKPAAGEAKSIRVTSSKLITKDGTTEPKAVLSLYEDFLCPACGNFEQQFGPTISKLIDSGAVAADYYMVAILDRPAATELLVACGATRPTASPTSRRTRSAASTPRCTPSSPARTAARFPDNARLIETRPPGRCRPARCRSASTAAVRRHGGGSGRGDERQLGTPTVRINGEDYKSDARPTRWSPRSRRSSATCPGLTPALRPRAPAPAPAAP